MYWLIQRMCYLLAPINSYDVRHSHIQLAPQHIPNLATVIFTPLTSTMVSYLSELFGTNNNRDDWMQKGFANFLFRCARTLPILSGDLKSAPPCRVNPQGLPPSRVTTNSSPPFMLTTFSMISCVNAIANHSMNRTET